MHPVPIEIICYHCQQSAEKYLKGYLALQGEEIKKTHDLIQLNKSCQEYDENFNLIENDCLMLTDYAVNIRYPFPLDINESDMSMALQGAKKIKEFVLSKAEIKEDDGDGNGDDGKKENGQEGRNPNSSTQKEYFSIPVTSGT